MNGAGHGSSVLGPDSTYWHFASMSLSINVNWERRLCMFLWVLIMTVLCSVILVLEIILIMLQPYQEKGEFRGWMLLSYKKPVTASSYVKNTLLLP